MTASGDLSQDAGPPTARVIDATEWAGSVGDVWAAEWQRTDRSFADLSPHLNAAAIAAVEGQAAPRILDIGCGAGGTSMALAAALPDAVVTGADISPGLIATARARAESLLNLRFELGPVEAIVGDHAPIDLFVSRHGVMFFSDPVAAFTAIRAAAAPAGRLVFSCFRSIALNPWLSEIITAMQGAPPPQPAGYMPGPFAFADPDVVRAILAAAGWRNVEARPIDYIYHAGAGPDPVGDALGFFSRIGPAASLLGSAEPELRETMRQRITPILEHHHKGGAVDFPGAAWLWSADNEQ